MKIKPGQAATAAALVGILGLGGMQMAGAQEDDSTTTTQDPSTEEVTPEEETPEAVTPEATEDPSTTDREPCEDGAGGGPRGDAETESQTDDASL